MRLTVIDRIKLEFNSYVETTGQDPTELIISEAKYKELCRMMSAEAVKYFNIGKVNLKVNITYEENCIYVCGI